MDATKEQGKRKYRLSLWTRKSFGRMCPRVVRQSVEETLSSLLEAESEALCLLHGITDNGKDTTSAWGSYPDPAKRKGKEVSKSPAPSPKIVGIAAGIKL